MAAVRRPRLRRWLAMSMAAVSSSAVLPRNYPARNWQPPGACNRWIDRKEPGDSEANIRSRWIVRQNDLTGHTPWCVICSKTKVRNYREFSGAEYRHTLDACD